MKRNKLLISILILTILLSVSGIIYDGFRNAPSRLKLNYRYLEHNEIHQDLDGLQIAFISDVNYNNFMDKQRFEQTVEKLTEANPDIVVFLGNLFDKENSNSISEKVVSDLQSQLNRINAKYGKFAVLGENDYLNEDVENIVSNILFESNFEIIRNDMIKISKDTKNTFQLVGIDSVLGGKDDIKKAYENVDEKNFTLTIISTPDTVKKLPQNKSDLVVAGHSLGGQINIPLLGQLYNKELAEEYYSGLYNVGPVKLYVSNGLGTSNKDVRIFAPAEIVIYTLKSK